MPDSVMGRRALDLEVIHIKHGCMLSFPLSDGDAKIVESSLVP